MKSEHLIETNFTTKNLLLVAIPAYFFPSVMSWFSGWILDNTILMKASYTSIAIPSLVATIIVYFILRQMQLFKKFPQNKYVRILVMMVLMILFSLIIIKLFKLEVYMLDIIPSSILGAIITTWKFPLIQYK
ncbi:hypothetical protein PG911_05035 [Tenacibaculum ovolyticum]|jgi:hypothetical protein|uniref:hypothetical protein n=1 Tax=Tenacibaculum ovolyticum TaxID=104270 RepID=UPI00041333B1|nr:hypothetical protein [Tenacibaculum ovolyticum]WBX77624.1 hypothetical protein PG911_05035 [Tenacibaculum ovolyticum]